VILTFVISLAIGWFAVAMSSRAAYATIDSSLNSIIDSGLHDPNSALSNALYVVERDHYDVTMDVVFPGDQVTQVNTASVPLTRRPTLADVKASRGHVTSVADLPGFAIRSTYVGGGDYLVVAASTAGVSKQNQHLAELVALAAVVIALIGLGAARILIRRDLRSMERLIGFASDVATGAELGPVPESEGSRDLKELASSLVVMVDALQERIEREANSARAMQQFIDDASHELRTPLTVVKGYTDILASGTVSAEQHERAVMRIQREADRMEELVRDLLFIARVREAPRHPHSIVDVSAIVSAAAGEFALEHPERAVEVHVDPGVELSTTEEIIDRLVGNAFTNIVRHTPPHAPVKVRLQKEPTRAILLIEDGGGGLPVYGERPQRFQRFDVSRSRETGGSGLGMSIMADVAESFGGTMTTEPSSLGGLGLRFEIPLTRFTQEVVVEAERT